ncbi:MAG: flagellar basal body rod modification protein, partial [Bacteroidota bacterium]
YGTGEFRGNSASGGGAPYRGDGIFKSTDGGSAWFQLPSTASGTPQVFDQMFDYVWNLTVDPSSPTDEIYAATIGGINRSIDGGATWATVLGGFSSGSPSYTDVSATSDGVVYATLSDIAINGGSGALSSGIWRSEDGLAWTRITPATWPRIYRRVAIGVVPSDEESVYFLGDTPGAGFQTVFAGVPEGHSLWRYEYLSGDGSGSGGIWQNRSAVLPALGGEVGDFASQRSFDLTVAVKPDDAGVVFIGGTNLYRSTNGFSDPGGTALIGGYAGPNDLGMYPNHHADQHALAFHPENPNTLFSGHDGGVSVTANAAAQTVVWQSLSNGYTTTQYFTLAIDRTVNGDHTILGGMQDNGTWMATAPGSAVPWLQLAGGDGAFCALAPGRTSYYVSTQNGVVYRLLLNANGSLANLARVDPTGGAGYLFINPFVLDPNDPRVMYMAGGRSLWRNSNLLSIPLGNREPTSVGWTNLEAAAIGGGVITALAVSQSGPEHRLYYGTSEGRVFVLDDAHTVTPLTQPREITAGLPVGGYVSCIAVDPEDGNQALLAFSNYNILSLFSTLDGGLSWLQVAGNLEEFADGSGSGPSVRWAAIQRYGGTPTFFLGTSTGLYSAQSLDGPSTVWVQEGVSSIGRVVVDMIDVR